MAEQFSFPGFGEPPPSQQPLQQQLFLALIPEANDAVRIAGHISSLCSEHRLHGKRLAPARLHVTLRNLPPETLQARRMLDDAAAVAASVARWPLRIEFDHALTFSGRHAQPGKHPFVFGGRNLGAVEELVDALGSELKRAGLPSRAGGKPHMTMLYDERIIQEHEIEPICWMASQVVLVLSHVGQTRHERLGDWPRAG